MNIYEMHVLFRTLGQQQGLQLVRGILPESIDNFLNSAIIQTTRIAILGNAQGSKDVITPQYTKISPFSAFHTLFCTNESNITLESDGVEKQIELDNEPLCVTNFVVKYSDGKKYDCRLIESERLHQTLNDYLNRASHEYPIVSLIQGVNNKTFVLSFYTGGISNENITVYTNYVRMPAKVKFDEDNTSNNIDCDLPEHLHTSIVELAVEMWFKSLGLTSGQPQENNNNTNTQ